MAEFAVFEKGKQAELLKRLKGKSGLTWIALSKKLGASKSMLMKYLTGDYQINHSILNKFWFKAINSLPPNLKIIRKGIFSPVQIVESEMPDNLAEFLDCLFGDGCLI